jgi:hypothetical protein
MCYREAVMDVSVLLEPSIDVTRLAEVLDGLGHEGRVHTIRTWSRKQQGAIFEAAKGVRRIDLDFFVPPSIGARVEVVHVGHNTLPMFSRFEKHFCKLEEGATSLAGWNHQSLEALTGPGYFIATKGDGEHEGEVVFDYTKTPSNKPEGWPTVRPNEGGLAGIVNGGLVDYVRGVSQHVSIGVAYRNGKALGQWFALVRKDVA